MFKFKGEWEFELPLNGFTNPHVNGFVKSANNKTWFEIIDKTNQNPDPELEQLNTINFILNEENQNKLINNLLSFSKNKVYPDYKELMDPEEDPECFPGLREVVDLGKLYQIDRIYIKTISNFNFAYYVIRCDSCLDHEHGLCFTLYKDQILDHHCGHDWDDREICNHMGIELDSPAYESFENENYRRYNNKAVGLIQAHSKYGKLKPWQKEQNDNYPHGLYRTKRYQELFEGINNGLISKDRCSTSILVNAINQEQEIVIKFFLDLFPRPNSVIFNSALEKDRYDITDLLIQRGYNLNEDIAQNSHFAKTIGHIKRAISERRSTVKYRIRIKYLLDNGLDPYLQDGWKRDSFYPIEWIKNEDLQLKVRKEIMNTIRSRNSFINCLRKLIFNK